jgi:hypothetical protein
MRARRGIMHEVHFHTTIGEDLIIHVPPGAALVPGDAEVIVRQKTTLSVASDQAPGKPREHLSVRLARLAEELGIDPSAFPPDLAENHDHYAHGAPRGIDKV